MELVLYDPQGVPITRNLPPEYMLGDEVGYAIRNTGNVTGVTAAAGVDVLSFPVTGDGVNPVYLEGHCAYALNNTANQMASLEIWDGAGGTGTRYNRALYQAYTANAGGEIHVFARIPPFIGTKTFYLRCATNGTSGTANFEANGDDPITFRGFRAKTAAQYALASVSLTNPLIAGAAQETTGADQLIDNWQTEIYDNADMHSTSTNPARITATRDGIFDCKLLFTFAGVAGPSGDLYCYIQHFNSAGTLQRIYLGQVSPWNTAVASSNFCLATADIPMAVGDYIQGYVAHFTGATRAFQSSSCYFQARWTGPIQTVSPSGAIFTSTLPTAPYDGQEINFQNAAMATLGIVWRFRYNAGSSSIYKWEFIGGPPIESQVDVGFAFESTASTAYTALATAGPVVTIPLAGDYYVEHGARAYQSAGTAVGTIMSYDIGGTAAVDTDAVAADAVGTSISAGRTNRKNGLAAGINLTSKYRMGGGGGNTGNWGQRWMKATPIRVG